MKIIEEKEEEKYFTLKNGKKVLISEIENNATEIKNETELLNCLNNSHKNYSIVDGIIYLIDEKSNHQFIKNNNDNCKKCKYFSICCNIRNYKIRENSFYNILCEAMMK